MFVCQRCRVLRWDLAPAPTSKTQHRTLTPPNRKCRLRAPGRQPPLTRGRRPLAAKGSSERAESRCPCAPGCSPPICSILCQDGHVLTIKIYLKICGRPSKFADQNLRWPGSKPVLWPTPPWRISKTKVYRRVRVVFVLRRIKRALFTPFVR